MALVSKSIPNFINGVSQQPPSLRLESQGEAQENGLSDVVDGLKKRPPTKFLKKLVRCNSSWTESISTADPSGDLGANNVQELTSNELASAYIHTYKRSADEQYTVVILPDATAPIVLTYDILGNLRYESGKSSWLADGTTIAYDEIDPATDLEVTRYGNSDDTSYLVGLNATALDKTDLTSTSIADATFLVNKTKQVEMSTSLAPEDTANEALVYLKSTNYGREYTVKITSQTKTTTIDSNAAGGNPVSTEENDSNNDKGFELRVSNIIEDLRSNLKDKAAVTSSVVASRSNPAGYKESNIIRAGQIAGTNGGTLFIPFGVDNQNLANTVAGITNAVTTNNKFLLQVTAGGRIVPYSSYNVVSSPSAGIEIANSYAWDQGQKVDVIKVNGVMGSTRVTSWRYPSNQITVSKLSADQTNQDIQFYPTAYNEEPFFVVSTAKSTDPTDASFGDFDILVTDDDGGSNLRAFKDTAKAFTDLPNQCVEGFRIAVVGDNQKKEDNFHVQFTGNGGSGYWKETVKAGIQNKFDLSTMPHTLRQDPDQVGSLRFSFDVGAWDDRVAGDEDTNPVPSFVGQSINDIFFHRNRLGIIAGENVIFSEASGYFNFFRTTVRALLDSAPIDVAVSQNEVSILKAAIPIQDNLLLFSELNQFTLSAAQLLTPTEVTIDQSTKFECDLEATPVGAGNSVFFATKSGGFAGVREYYTNNETEIKDATLITSHVPQYLAGNVRKMAASSNENILICLTNGDKKEAYIYNWYDQSNERLQSAWSKWKFNKEIEDVSFNNAALYLVFNDGSFEYLDLVPTSTEEATTIGTTIAEVPVAFESFLAGSINVGTVIAGGMIASNGLVPPTRIDPNIPYSADNYLLVLWDPQKSQVSLLVPIVWRAQNTPTYYNIGSQRFAMADAFPQAGDISGIPIDTILSGWTWDLTADQLDALVALEGQTVDHSFLSGSLGAGGTVTLDATNLDPYLDHRVIITADTLGGSVTSLVGSYTPTAFTEFVDFRGKVVARGNTPEELAKVYAALSNKTHLQEGVEVNDYIYVGEPYQFKYQLSEQVYKPAEGDYTDLSRLQIRSMSIHYNDTGAFSVVVDSSGRDGRVTPFTGRILGQKDNILDYSPVVENGTIKIGVQSQAKETDITITNDSHLPCVFQSAEWEGFITLRNQRL